MRQITQMLSNLKLPNFGEANFHKLTPEQFLKKYTDNFKSQICKYIYHGKQEKFFYVNTSSRTTDYDIMKSDNEYDCKNNIHIFKYQSFLFAFPILHLDIKWIAIYINNLLLWFQLGSEDRHWQTYLFLINNTKFNKKVLDAINAFKN